MENLDITIVNELRSMATQGEQPSQMLHAIIAHLDLKTPNGLSAEDRLLLVDYFAASFCFTEGQGYPIFGWSPDAGGELKDADIDRIMARRIGATETDWNCRSPVGPENAKNTSSQR